jgi:hypothetical protein
MQTTEIILRDNGTLTERVIRERNLNAEESVLESLTDGVNRPMRNVYALPNWGLVHANVGRNDTLWTVGLNRIPLHAHFRLINQVLVPAFASVTDVEMPVVWQSPSSMRLAFVVRTEFEGTTVRADNRGYRLPLPNLHDDCLLCAGGFAEHHPSGQDGVAASLEQFRKSKWNADLMRTVEQSQQMFRFQPTNGTFETLPPAVPDWTTLCDKVSTDILGRVIL